MEPWPIYSIELPSGDLYILTTKTEASVKIPIGVRYSPALPPRYGVVTVNWFCLLLNCCLSGWFIITRNCENNQQKWTHFYRERGKSFKRLSFWLLSLNFTRSYYLNMGPDGERETHVSTYIFLLFKRGKGSCRSSGNWMAFFDFYLRKNKFIVSV